MKVKYKYNSIGLTVNKWKLESIVPVLMNDATADVISKCEMNSNDVIRYTINRFDRQNITI